MDVDLIKSSASTAEHNHHQSNHRLDHMMSIMMQMEKPATSPHHNNNIQQPQFCEPNPTFLDINFSDPTTTITPNNPNPNPNPNPNNSHFVHGLITNPNHHHQYQQGTTTVMISTSPYDQNNGDNNNKRSNGSMAAMREMIFRIAAMQPIDIEPESIKPPKRRNVRISKDPQSVAARHRRERISERIRILQRLVPGGTKMDTASMLDEAIHYVKFLKKQLHTLEQAGANRPAFPVASSTARQGVTYDSAFLKPTSQPLTMVDQCMRMLR